jgi:hypothetical protein
MAQLRFFSFTEKGVFSLLSVPVEANWQRLCKEVMKEKRRKTNDALAG